MKSIYCDWGICNPWEYCCGRNECCHESDLNLLILVAGVLGTVLMVALCCCCLYYKSRHVRAHITLLSKYMGINYVRMSIDPAPKTIASADGEATGSTVCIVQMDKNKLIL